MSFKIINYSSENTLYNSISDSLKNFTSSINHKFIAILFQSEISAFHNNNNLLEPASLKSEHTYTLKKNYSTLFEKKVGTEAFKSQLDKYKTISLKKFSDNVKLIDMLSQLQLCNTLDDAEKTLNKHEKTIDYSEEQVIEGIKKILVDVWNDHLKNCTKQERTETTEQEISQKSFLTEGAITITVTALKANGTTEKFSRFFQVKILSSDFV